MMELILLLLHADRLCGLVEFLATHPEVPGYSPGANRFSEK
jgi:hypothetical protein